MRVYVGGLLALGLAVMLQSAVVSQWHLLQGVVDLPLLVWAAWVTRERRFAPAWFWAVAMGALWGLYSALPPGTGLLIYGGIGLVAQALQRRIWHPPYLLLFVLVFLGSLWVPGVSYLIVRFGLQASIPFRDALVQVILPTVLLNLLAALPVYAVVAEWADWVLPAEEPAGG
jgi:cell shape-determining protein MreD